MRNQANQTVDVNQIFGLLPGQIREAGLIKIAQSLIWIEESPFVQVTNDSAYTVVHIGDSWMCYTGVLDEPFAKADSVTQARALCEEHLHGKQAQAEEAPAEASAADTDGMMREVKELFESTYDSKGPDGLLALCYSGHPEEVTSSMKEMLEEDPEATIDAMVKALAASPEAVNAWTAFTDELFLNQDPAPAEAAAEAPAVQEPHEAEEKEPEFKVGDAIEPVNAYGMVAGKAVLVSGIKQGHYLGGYSQVKLGSFQEVESLYRRCGSQTDFKNADEEQGKEKEEKTASRHIAVDQTTENYFKAYFKAYGAMLVRPLAFKKVSKKIAQIDQWVEVNTGSWKGEVAYVGKHTLYVAEDEPGAGRFYVLITDKTSETVADETNFGSLDEAKNWAKNWAQTHIRGKQAQAKLDWKQGDGYHWYAMNMMGDEEIGEVIQSPNGLFDWVVHGGERGNTTSLSEAQKAVEDHAHNRPGAQ